MLFAGNFLAKDDPSRSKRGKPLQMAPFLRKHKSRTPHPAMCSLGLCLITTLALCGSASADPVTGLLTTTASQVNSTVTPTTQAVDTVVANAATNDSVTEPTPSVATPSTPSQGQPATAAADAVDAVVHHLAKPSSTTPVVGSITKALGAADEHARQLVSHTLTHSVNSLEQAVTKTASGTLPGASSSVKEIARNASHTLGPTLADRTSQIIIPQTAKDAGDALDRAPATDAQPLGEPRLSLTPAPPIVSARAGVSSFVISAHSSTALTGHTSSPGTSVSGRGPEIVQQAHGDAALPGDPVSPAPGGSSSSAVAGSAGSGALLFLAIVGLFTLAGPWASRRLRILSDPQRPAPFVLIPQRPG
jgi:hypothetical protein